MLNKPLAVLYLFVLLYSYSLQKTSGVYCTNLDGNITVKDISNGKTIYYYETGNLFEGRSPKISIIR
jgi:hypothetical protein